MENASKALLIAGGIFLTIIIVTALIFAFSNITNWQAQIEKKNESKSLQEFNAQFEAYNKKIMYGADIITVVNKVIQNNKDNINNINVILQINNNENFQEISNGSNTLNDDLAVSIEKLKNVEEFKIAIFTCTNVRYDANGRIYEMTFRQK